MNHKAVLRALALMLCLVQLLHARDVNPVLLSTYPAPSGGTTTDVAVSGNFVYACEGEKGLTILDVTNPSSPQLVGSVDTPGFASAVVVSNNLAFIADGAAGLTLVDVSNRAAPSIVGGYDTLGNCIGVTVVGNLAYLADGDYGLQIIDCSNPAQPVRLGGYNTFGTALSVAISGNYAFVADGNNGLVVIDVSNPSVPRKIGGFAGLPATHIAISGAYAYVASNGPLVIFDISDPLNPQPISSVDLPGAAVAGSAISGTTVYVASGLGRFNVLDATDPFSPTILGTAILLTNGVRVAAAGPLTFAADLTNGVRVIAAANPAVMDVLAHVPIEGAITDIATSGNYAYVAAGQTMQVVNISKIDDPRVVANYRVFADLASTSIRRVAIFDTYAFLAGGNGYEIVSISDVSNPTKIASATGGSVSDVKGEGPYLFLANSALSIYRSAPAPAGLQTVGGFYSVGGNVFYSSYVVAVRGTNAWAVGLKSMSFPPSPPSPLGTYGFKLNISNLSQPSLMNEASLTSVQGSPSQMAISDKYAFVLFKRNLSYEQTTLRALRLDSLSEVAYRDASILQQFAVGPNALYLANGSQGVEVLGIDTALFAPLGGAGLPDATAIAVNTNYVFVGAGTNGLYVMTHYQPSVRLAAEMSANQTPLVKTFGPIGASGRLQRATDFTTNSFQDWQTIQLNSYPQIVTDTNSPRAFYRFVSP